MPLITDERTAVEILIDLKASYPSVSPANFARTVLGAHSEQAKRLADMAVRGELPDAAPAEDDVTVTRTVEGKEMSISLKAGKLPITSYDELVDFYEIDTARWRPTHQTYNFWGSEGSPNFQVKANFTEVEYRGLTDADRQATRDWYASLGVQWPTPTLERPEGNLLEIVISDLHADKRTVGGPSMEQHLLRVKAAVQSLLVRGQADGLERIALVFLGDTFHHEGNGMTTSGTPQDTVGEPRETYVRIRDFIGQLALYASSYAPVDLYVLSGNHDRERAFYAVDSLHGLLRGSGVTVSVDTRRAVIDWGINLIGVWHGDRQKPADIAMTLLREFDTSGKKVFEVHLGHTHTRHEEEVHGVLLRRFRSPTKDDAWHHDRLFNHNLKSITGILWNRDRGEVATYPVAFVGDQ